jgi:hypothetical protein
MKNKNVAGILLAVLGALISLLPTRLIDKHCVTEQLNCYWTGKTELGLGILIVILALLLITIESRETRMGISLSLALIGLFSALVTSVLIGFCGAGCGAKCTCSPAAPYIMTGLNALVVLISLLHLLQLRKSGK